MSGIKQQKERNKAIQHLYEFIEQSDVWGPRLTEMTAQYMQPVVEYFDEDEASVQRRLQQSPFAPTVYDFIMEMMGVSAWDSERVTPIDVFLKQRGWREGQHGRQYLRAINESDVHLVEITAVEPGHWIDVRPYGTQASSKRITEWGASKKVRPYDILLARLVPLGKSHRFGAILPMTQQAARQVKEHVDSTESELKAFYEEVVAEEGPEGLVENFADSIDVERQTRVEETGFMCFVIDALTEPSQESPQMCNTDNEPIVISKTRVPIIGDIQQIRDTLSGHDALIDHGDEHWSWLKSDVNNTLIGSFKIQGENLVFESNSVERAERGVALLQACLGDELIGAPMSVHESIENVNREPMATAASSNSIDLSQHPELQSVVQDMMKKQYMSALNDAIPMLDNESPRACAADPEKRHKAIDWVKYLENQESKSPTPSFDFTWLWEELELADYR